MKGQMDLMARAEQFQRTNGRVQRHAHQAVTRQELMGRFPIPKTQNFIRVRCETQVLEAICSQGGLDARAHVEEVGLFAGTTKLFVAPTPENDHMRRLRNILTQYSFRKVNAMWEPQQPI